MTKAVIDVHWTHEVPNHDYILFISWKGYKHQWDINLSLLGVHKSNKRNENICTVHVDLIIRLYKGLI